MIDKQRATKFLKGLEQSEVEAYIDAGLEIVGNEYKSETNVNFRSVHFSETFAEAEKREKNPNAIEGYTTGFSELDKLIGGILPEEVMIVGGMTGHGKSQFVQSLALNMALNMKKVLFISLEMSNVEVSIRLRRMIKNTRTPVEMMSELPINYFAGDMPDFDSIEKLIEQTSNDMDVIFIDHIHFFPRNTDNPEAEMSIYTQKLKWIARKFHKPIIAVSHLKKLNNPNAKANLDDLKGSSSIAQDADIVMMIFRDLKNRHFENGNGRGMLAVVRKNRRRGTLGTVGFVMSEHGYPIQEDHRFKDEEDF